MTWAVVARDPRSGLYGIALASRFFAAGALCMYTEAGTGAASIQSLPNPTLGPRALALLRIGYEAAAVRDMLVGSDAGIAMRQLHLMDRHGRSAAFTGDGCIDWAGHREGTGMCVAGNMLAGPGVVDSTFETFAANADLPFVDRLLAAMEAGEAAGGDKRGKQAAALCIQGAEPYRRLDLRVDDHPDPLAELRRLHEVAKSRYLPFSRACPTAEHPYGILDRAVVERFVEEGAGKDLEQVIPLPKDRTLA